MILWFHSIYRKQQHIKLHILEPSTLQIHTEVSSLFRFKPLLRLFITKPFVHAIVKLLITTISCGIQSYSSFRFLPALKIQTMIAVCRSKILNKNIGSMAISQSYFPNIFLGMFYAIKILIKQCLLTLVSTRIWKREEKTPLTIAQWHLPSLAVLLLLLIRPVWIPLTGNHPWDEQQ